MLSLLLLFLLIITLVWGLVAAVRVMYINNQMDKNIFDPWSEAIKDKDWPACDHYELLAKQAIKDMSDWSANPLRWFKRLPF